MFFLREPNDDQLRAFYEAQKNQPFSYAETGASQHAAPPRYNLDHNRIKLGTGAQVFAQAVGALQHWQMFNLGWVRVWQGDLPLEIGACAIIIARHFGFYSVNACRLVYVIDEDAPIKKYGFAYGTLAAHMERGEERFTIEWNREDDFVWYDLLAFSQPRHWLAKLGYPMSRHLQQRFVRDSKQAMFAAVNAPHDSAFQSSS